MEGAVGAEKRRKAKAAAGGVGGEGLEEELMFYNGLGSSRTFRVHEVQGGHGGAAGGGGGGSSSGGLNVIVIAHASAAPSNLVQVKRRGREAQTCSLVRQ